MSDILGDLNPRQKQAVQHTEGPLLILAGAGSGKTRVITHRIAHLVHKGISPSNILAVTFTNKAADEMRQRVIRMLEGNALRIYIPLICTFHSLATRVLRDDIYRIGGRRDFVIYDEGGQFSLIKECLKELRIDEKKFRVSAVASAINKAKDDLVDFESYQIYTAASGDYYREVVNDIYTLYARKLSRNNALDFGDLIMKCVQLLRQNADVLDKYQERFRYIMVDEYQDTNHAQYMLMKLLGKKYSNICVVGDEDQSIYMWRGADMRNILHFEKDYARKNSSVRVFKMMENYRSAEDILNAANNLIKHNVYRRHDKGVLLKAGGKQSKKKTCVKFMELLNETEEALYVVNEIKSILKKKNSRAQEIAVFYRTNAQSRIFEDIFRAENIKYTIIGSVEFYERREIKDILGYLRLIVNPSDSVALRRIINIPNRGIGKVTISALEQFALKHGISLYDALLGADKINSINESKKKLIKNFVSFIENLRKNKEILSVAEVTSRLIDEVGYIRALEAEDTFESRARIENAKELISAMREFEERSPAGNAEFFLEQISLMDSSGVVPEGYNVDDNKNQGRRKHSNDAVVLMTLHLAKGLEFDNVFVTGLEEGLLPHINSMASEAELEEERRLCYVGMTRAKRQLYLTCSSERRLYGIRRWNLPSRFVNEARVNLGTAKKVGRKESCLWRIGQRVKHPMFGDGKILDKSGSGNTLKMVVLFNDGQRKKLLVKYAGLEKY